MKKLFAFDLVFLGYLGIVTVLVLLFRPPGTAIYLACHAAGVLLVAGVVSAFERWGGRFWIFVRYWYVVPVMLASFRELHYLVPAIHPFDDHRFDRALAGIDRAILGDVDGFFLSLAHPLLVDFLHLCYWSYFVLPLVPAAALYARGELARLREFSTLILTALYASYLGYFAVPAVGPVHLFPTHPPELDGWILGASLHAAMKAIELRMPDAFPSGHALTTLTALLMAWRHHRPSFWGILVPAAGCVAATMALRYHYVADVAAAAALLPVVFLGGLSIARARERAAV